MTESDPSATFAALKCRSAAFSCVTVMCYRMCGSVGAGTNSFIAPGKKPRRKLHVRHEKATIHHAGWRRGGVATGGAGATANDARDWVSQQRVTRRVHIFCNRVPQWSEGSWIYRGPQRRNRI